MSDDRITINESTRIRGRHASVDVQAEELVHDFSERKLTARIAKAGAEAIKRGFSRITERASAGTLRKREQAAAAWRKGAAWALERYGGRAPNQSQMLFNDSGRLRESIGVREEAEGHAVTVDRSRLGGKDLAAGELAAMEAKLKQLVPEIENPFTDPEVKKAAEESVRDMITKKPAGRPR